MQEASEESTISRLGVLSVLQLVSGYGLACGCFVFGIPLGGWQFWLSALAAISLGFCRSRRLGFGMIGLNALVFLLTLFTFTYVHCDSAICHLPMSHFLADGWNPVRDASLETVKGYYAMHGIPDIRTFDALHVLIDPKFTQILAAQFQSAFCLFSALAYPLWFMTFALGLTAWRFARETWSASKAASAAFAVVLCVNPFIFRYSLMGLVDLVTYGAVVTAALSLALWHQGRRRDDLVMFFAAIITALVSKFTGLCCSILLLILAVAIGWRDRQMRRALALFTGAAAFLLILPYWVSAYWHGSPFYPAHTFRKGVVLPDLTDDFLPLNADAAGMGYLARMTYAWISKPLACWASGLCHGTSAIRPEWCDEAIVGGAGAWFPLIFWPPAIASFFVRRNRATVIGWTILLSFFLVPLKYIGFARYVAPAYAAMVILWFNLVFAAPDRWRRVLDGIVLAVGSGFALYAVLTYWQLIRDEGIRQVNLERVGRADPAYQLSGNMHRMRYELSCLMALHEGWALSEEPSERDLLSEWYLFPTGPDFLTREKGFPWGPNDHFPSPLWQRPHHPGHESVRPGCYPNTVLQP